MNWLFRLWNLNSSAIYFVLYSHSNLSFYFSATHNNIAFNILVLFKCIPCSRLFMIFFFHISSRLLNSLLRWLANIIMKAHKIAFSLLLQCVFVCILCLIMHKRVFKWKNILIDLLVCHRVLPGVLQQQLNKSHVDVKKKTKTKKKKKNIYIIIPRELLKK